MSKTPEQKLTTDTIALCARLIEYFEATTANLLEHCDALEVENAKLKAENQQRRDTDFDRFIESLKLED
jgi:hypothetical protein